MRAAFLVKGKWAILMLLAYNVLTTATAVTLCSAIM
jgi:hypothetical protein